MKIGYDVEVFYGNSRRADSIIPPLWCEGTKSEPVKIPNGPGYWQRDGVALELNGVPTTGYHTFAKNAATQLSIAMAQADGYRLHLMFCADSVLDDLVLDSPAARDIGCEPDWNAWTEKINPPQDYMNLGNRRFAGGHLHFSWPGSWKASIREKFQMVRTLDLLLGSLVIRGEEGTGLRRNYYGRSGACRIKPYGVEWRVPDNSWFLSSSVSWAKQLFSMANKAAEVPTYADLLRKKNPVLIEEHMSAINSSDFDAANDIHTLLVEDLRSA